MRISTSSLFTRLILGIERNRADQVRAQDEIASGKRILKPSDDPAGAAKIFSLERGLADLGRYGDTIQAGQDQTSLTASTLQDASTVFHSTRALLLQALNGPLVAAERNTIATQFEAARDGLFELANRKVGGHYLFGGTETGSRPFQESIVDGRRSVSYAGNEELQLVRIAEGVDVPVNLPGRDIFGRFDREGVTFGGETGVVSGTTADEGDGYGELIFRHDSTDGSGLGAGVVLVNGGAEDTLLGDNSLVIDSVAGTIQLGSGTAIGLPDPAGPDAADFVVRNELGGELHLDLTGYTGIDFTGTVSGAGSVSFDGTSYTALDFTETDLELRNDAAGQVIHVDTAGVRRAGRELVTFQGATNVFDLLDGVVNELRNEADYDLDELQDRLSNRLADYDLHHESVLAGVGVAGARSQRLQAAETRNGDVRAQFELLLSDHQDADIAEVASELARSELLLQATQAAGVRIIQTTLLSFLR